MYLYDMPYNYRRELCQVLDLLDNAWRTLAGSVGLSALEVRRLEEEIHKPSGSPSAALLDKLGLKNFTVDELACKLKEIKMMRAVHILEPLVSKNLYASLTEMSTKEQGPNRVSPQLPSPSAFRVLQHQIQRMNYEQMKTKTIDNEFLEQLKKDESAKSIDEITKNEKTTKKKEFNTETFELVKLKNNNSVKVETNFPPSTDSENTGINSLLKKDLEMMDMMKISLLEDLDGDESIKNEGSDVMMNSGNTNETFSKTSDEKNSNNLKKAENQTPNNLKNTKDQNSSHLRSSEDQLQSNLKSSKTQNSNMSESSQAHNSKKQDKTKETKLTAKKVLDTSSLSSTSTSTSLLDNLTVKQLEALLSDTDASDYTDLYNIMKKEDASRYARLEKLRQDLEENEDDD